MIARNHRTAPTEADVLLAKESLHRLSQCTGPGNSAIKFQIQGVEQPVDEIELPFSVFGLLKDILAEMAEGHAVNLLPMRAELTTQQAADLLSVSRPYLIGLLEQGKIPFRYVGQHRRVRLDDFLAYKHKDDDARRQTAGAWTADGEAPEF